MRRDLYFALRGTVARAHVRRLATRTSSCVGSRFGSTAHTESKFAAGRYATSFGERSQIQSGGSVDWPSTRLVVDRTYTADDRPSGCAAGDQYAQLHACVVARSIRRTVAVDRDAFRLVTR